MLSCDIQNCLLFSSFSMDKNTIAKKDNILFCLTYYSIIQEKTLLVFTYATSNASVFDNICFCILL